MVSLAYLVTHTTQLLGRKPLRTFKQRTRVMALEVCDGMLLTAAGSDGEIGVNDPHKGLLEVVKGHQGAVLCLLKHAGYLWSGGDDKSINVRGLVYPYPLLNSIEGLPGAVGCMCPGSGVVYYTAESNKIYRFSVVPGKLFRQLPSLLGHRTAVTGLQYHSGSLWSSGGSTVVRWTSNSTPKIVVHEQTEAVSCFLVTTDAVFVGAEDGKVTVFNHVGQLTMCLESHQKAVKSIAHWGITATLFTSAKDGEVKIWNLREPKPQPETLVQHERNVTSLYLLGSTLFTGGTDKKLVSWNVSDYVGFPTTAATQEMRQEQPAPPQNSCCAMM